MEITLTCIIGYLCGSFLTAVLVSKKFTGKDVSQIAEGNPGMANVMLNIGYKPGFIVLFGDVLKVVIAFVITYFLFFDKLGPKTFLYAGFSAIIGHNYPFWRKFKGGKGVTVTCVWLVKVMGWFGLLACLISAAVTLLFGYLNIGAVLIPIAATILAYFYFDTEVLIFVAISAVIMVIRNRHDLKNIIEGKDKPLFRRKKE